MQHSKKNPLALKIPPVVIFLFSAVLMWLIKKFTPFLTLDFNFSMPVAAILVISGFCVVMVGALAIRRAGTTVHPMKPETTTVLVMNSVYRFSRNPIYLGLTLILLGWGIYLSNLLSLTSVAFFMLYMTNCQIKPEEEILQKLFGARFEQYKNQVRRWL